MRGQRQDKVSCLWPIGLRVQNLHQAPKMSSAVTGPCALEGSTPQCPGWRCLSRHALSSSDSGRREEVSSNVGVECLGKESSKGGRGEPVV